VIAVVDYGASNVQSVLRAFTAVDADAALTDDPDAVRAADRVVVPGVGHFAPAKRRLDETGLGDAIGEVARAGRPLLGICLGLQLLLEESEEAPGVPGLAVLSGRVARFKTSLPVPHVGWARVRLTARGRAHPVLAPAFSGDEAYFYHVHSYHPEAVEPPGDLAEAEYGAPFPTIVGRDHVLGVQFHPEKSQTAGLALVREFARWKP
jgi:imidazole glycerol-phosphate synthase subunit HisH